MSYGEFGDAAQAAINTLKAGGSVQPEATLPESAVPENEAEIDESKFDVSADYDSEESNEEEDNSEELEVSEDADDLEDSDSEPELEDIEYITADNKKIKVDFTDREKTKKAYQMAAGMRKAFSEKDEAVKGRDEYKSKYEENQKTIDGIDALMEAQDYDAGFKIMFNKSLEDVIEERIAENDRLSKLSPAEIDAYKSKREVDRRRSELDKREKALSDRETKATDDLSASDLNKQQTMLNSAFDKHRFAGKFGSDAQAKKREHTVDQMLWRTVTDNLSALGNVDQETVEKTVREAAESLSEIINVQATKKKQEVKKTEKNVAKKKAKEAAFDKNSTGDLAKKKDLQSKVRSGNLKDAIGGILSGDFNSIF